MENLEARVAVVLKRYLDKLYSDDNMGNFDVIYGELLRDAIEEALTPEEMEEYYGD